MYGWLFKRHEEPNLPPNGLESNCTNEKLLAKSCLNIAHSFLLKKKKKKREVNFQGLFFLL